MQKTLKNKFEITGIGLHSGKDVTAVVSPAPIDTGIQFKRCDINHCNFTRITPYNVSSTQLATTIECDNFQISTIEHFSAALYGMGIDNAYISVYGAEIPILDGSAKDIIDNILKVGIIEQNKPRKVLEVVKPVSINLDGKTVEIEPYDKFQVTFELDYDHPIIGKQIYTYNHSEEVFAQEIGLARTFGFKREVEALHSMGLAKGGSLDNAIVIGDEEGILNPGGLRVPSEFVRHKILDMFGDLALIGYKIKGKINAVKSGHQVNNVFARALLEATNSYIITDEVSNVEEKVSKKESSKVADKNLVGKSFITPSVNLA